MDHLALHASQAIHTLEAHAQVVQLIAINAVLLPLAQSATLIFTCITEPALIIALQQHIFLEVAAPHAHRVVIHVVVLEPHAQLAVQAGENTTTYAIILVQ